MRNARHDRVLEDDIGDSCVLLICIGFPTILLATMVIFGIHSWFEHGTQKESANRKSFLAEMLGKTTEMVLFEYDTLFDED